MRKVLLALIVLSAIAGVSFAQQHASKKEKEVSGTVATDLVYTPTDLQIAQLTVAQKDVLIQQLVEQSARENLQRANAALTQAAEKVKKDNDWPAVLQFDVNKLAFFMPPPPPEKKEN